MATNLFGFDASYAALVTAYLNLVNFTGRFGWGFLSDRIGRKAFFVMSAVTQLGALILMIGAIRARFFQLWLGCFLTIGSLYGGLFGVLPATLSDLFGPRISSATHGAVIAMWALSVVVGVPVFGAVTRMYSHVTADGHVTPTDEAYIVNASWLAFFPTVAAGAAILLTLNPEDRGIRREAATAAGTRATAFLVRLAGRRRRAAVCTVGLAPGRLSVRWAADVQPAASDGAAAAVDSGATPGAAEGGAEQELRARVDGDGDGAAPVEDGWEGTKEAAHGGGRMRLLDADALRSA